MAFFPFLSHPSFLCRLITLAKGLHGSNAELIVHGFHIIASITWRSRIFMIVPVGKVIA